MGIMFCSCYERPCIIIYLYDKPTWSRQKWCLDLFLGLCKFYQLRMWETDISGLDLVALIRLLTTHSIDKGFTSRMKCTIWTQHAWENTPTFLHDFSNYPLLVRNDVYWQKVKTMTHFVIKFLVFVVVWFHHAQG